MLECDDQADLQFVSLRVLLELAGRVDVEPGDEVGLVCRVDAAPKVREVLDRLAAGQLVVERELARQVADAAMDGDGISRRLDPEDGGPAAGRPEVVEQDPDRRRLAGAVRAKEAERLALGDLEVDIDDAAGRAVGLGELVGPEGRGHDGSFPPASAGIGVLFAARCRRNPSMSLGNSASMNATTSWNSRRRASALAELPDAARPCSAISRRRR